MSCERVRQIDLDAYLADPRAAEWADFRAHFPDCASCSATLAGATRFEETLGEAAGGAHPDAEALAVFARRGAAAEAQADIAAHVSTCASCRDSLAAFERFQHALASEAALTPRPAARSEGLRAVLAGLGERLLPSAPAWAAAAVVLIAVGSFLLVGDSRDPDPGARGLAAGAPERPVPSPERPAPAAGDEALLADRGPSTPEPAETPPVPEVAQPGEPVLARRVPEARPTPQAPAPPPAPVPAPEPAAPDPFPEPLLLAMASLPAPEYMPPADALSGVRVAGGVRGAGPEGRVMLRVLAPSHMGRTAAASPTLYWFVDRGVQAEGTFTLEDEDSGDFHEVSLGGVHRAGIHPLSLADMGIELELGRRYRWHVSLSTDAGPGLTATGGIERTVAELPGDPLDRAQRSAAAGLWYDALERLSAALQAGGSRRIAAHRIALLEQGDLPEVAAFERARSE